MIKLIDTHYGFIIIFLYILHPIYYLIVITFAKIFSWYGALCYHNKENKGRVFCYLFQKKEEK